MTIYVLGAGPTGMAIVDGITDSNLDDFVVFEKSNSIGGLAQTIYWNDIGYHDLGPHKIFSQDQNLVNRIEKLLSEKDWITKDKISSIYMKGYFLPYPPSPFSLGKVFGLKLFIQMCFGYAFAIIKSFFSKQNPKTFEEDLTLRLGHPLYNLLFEPIAKKLWGNPKELDMKLSRGRIQTPSIMEILLKIFGIQKKSNFEALTFRYPKGGLVKLWESIINKSKSRGSFLLEHEISGINIKDDRIVEISSKKNGKEVKHLINPNDYVVTSLPLGITVPLLKKYVGDQILKTVKEVVVLNDLILVFLHIDKKSFIDESWIFVPDPDIIFHRISEQESFDQGMVENGSIVCCEIMINENKKISFTDEEELFALTERDLNKMGYKNFKILSKKIINLPKSYPVYKKGYEAGLTKILNKIDKLENFKTVGRQGSFNYIGTLDAMDIGYGFTKWYKHRTNKEWQKERDRTSYYPVLD